MAGLDAEIKVRLEQEAKDALERLAAVEDRKPMAIARRLIREGLVRAGELEEAVNRG